MEQYILVSDAKLIKPIGTCEGKAVFWRRTVTVVCLKETAVAMKESQPLKQCPSPQKPTHIVKCTESP